jgi:hypothetical protein
LKKAQGELLAPIIPDKVLRNRPEPEGIPIRRFDERTRELFDINPRPV